MTKLSLNNNWWIPSCWNQKLILIIKPQCSYFLTVACIDCLNLSSSIQISFYVAFIITNNESFTIFTQHKMRDIRLLFSFFIFDNVCNDLFSLPISNVNNSNVWLGSYTHLVKVVIELYANWIHIPKFYAICIHYSFIFEFKPMQSILYSNKLSVINVYELMYGWFAFKVKSLNAV